MIYSIILPLMIGAFGVLQNTLNKKLAGTMGLPMALVINNIVLLISALLFFFFIRLPGEDRVPEIFRTKLTESFWNVQYLVPGLLGFFIIVTAPWSIEKVGATKVFVMIIVAQVVTSLAWDYWVESSPMPPLRLAGALIAAIGAFIAVRS